MANPSAKASRPSRSSLHTRILPSVATLNSREWFLCVVSGNQLTCSKCHELRTTGTVTTAQPMQPAVPGSTRTQEQSQAPAWYQTGFSWELAQTQMQGEKCSQVFRAESPLQFLWFTCPQFWDGHLWHFHPAPNSIFLPIR